MTQEEQDFIFFEQNQLKDIDFTTGNISIYRYNKKKIALNAGSINQDGYVRIWCNGHLRMKHRLIYWLYYKNLPIEVDHKNGIRNDNSISNLISVNRKQNTTNKKQKRSYSHLTIEQVHELCAEIAKGNLNITQLAKQYNRSRCQIKAILSKKYWKQISDQYF